MKKYFLGVTLLGLSQVQGDQAFFNLQKNAIQHNGINIPAHGFVLLNSDGILTDTIHPELTQITFIAENNISEHHIPHTNTDLHIFPEEEHQIKALHSNTSHINTESTTYLSQKIPNNAQLLLCSDYECLSLSDEPRKAHVISETTPCTSSDLLLLSSPLSSSPSSLCILPASTTTPHGTIDLPSSPHFQLLYLSFFDHLPQVIHQYHRKDVAYAYEQPLSPSSQITFPLPHNPLYLTPLPLLSSLTPHSLGTAFFSPLSSLSPNLISSFRTPFSLYDVSLSSPISLESNPSPSQAEIRKRRVSHRLLIDYGSLSSISTSLFEELSYLPLLFPLPSPPSSTNSLPSTLPDTQSTSSSFSLTPPKKNNPSFRSTAREIDIPLSNPSTPPLLTPHLSSKESSKESSTLTHRVPSPNSYLEHLKNKNVPTEDLFLGVAEEQTEDEGIDQRLINNHPAYFALRVAYQIFILFSTYKVIQFLYRIVF